MKITGGSNLDVVAAAVADALEKAGLKAVLTGGGCAMIYSGGEYQSEDLDLVLQRETSQEALDAAMTVIGFRREVDRYTHSKSRFFVEFVPGPLSIGRDVKITPVQLDIGGMRVSALSPTDSCRDRLAAFYHWNDRQSLETAVAIAVRRKVNIDRIRKWSRAEGAASQFQEFERELVARRKLHGTRARRRAVV